MEEEKILVVDDDLDILEFLTFFLQVKGYFAKGYSTALEALAELKNVDYPVIITDIMMPGINGLMFLHQITKKFPETMVVTLTAHATLDTAIKSLNEGAFAFLNKPFKNEELLTTVERALDKHRLFQQNKQLIEELRKAKEFNEQIIQSMVYALLVVDLDGKIKKINKATEQLLGYWEEELIGKQIEIVFPEEFSKTMIDELIKQKNMGNFQLTFVNKEKKKIPVIFSGSPMKDNDGNLIGLLGMARELKIK